MGDRDRDRQAIGELERALRKRGQRLGQHVLAADGVRSEHDRRSQQVQGKRRVGVGLLAQEPLELGLLLRVEQPGRRAGRPVLGHPDRVVAMKTVGGDRRGVHEPGGAGGGCGAEHVQRAVDVDRADRLAGRRAGDHEREVDDHVRSFERLPERVGLAHVALAVLHLAPAVLGRVERAAGDSDDARDPVIGLEQRDQPGAEGPRRAGDGDGQRLVRQASPRGRTGSRRGPGPRQRRLR